MVLIKDIQLVDDVPYSGPERRIRRGGIRTVALNILGMAIGIVIGYLIAISN